MNIKETIRRICLGILSFIIGVIKIAIMASCFILFWTLGILGTIIALVILVGRPSLQKFPLIDYEEKVERILGKIADFDFLEWLKK